MSNTNTNTGSKHEATEGMNTTEIAKLVRADLKALMPKGFKLSVRTSYASMCSSISVTVKAVPAGFQIWTDEFLDACVNEPHRLFEGERMTAEARVVIRAIERAVNAYNRTSSDWQSDYYHCRFYDHVRFDHALERADREARSPKKAA